MVSIHDTTTFDLDGSRTIRRLGYGAMQITGDGVWGEPGDPEGAKQVLRAAVDLGINFIDTADSYGPDVSERLIGEALAPYPDDLIIATKAGLTRPGPGEWEPDGRPEHIRDACEGSLRRLQLDCIPLYQLHRIDPDVPVAESIGAMVDLRSEGKIDMIGVSEVSVEELREVQDECAVSAVQNLFNIAEQKWADVVDACRDDGIAFIPWFPLGSSDLGELADALDDVADAHDTDRFAVALAWLLHCGPNVVPIPGTKSVEHLESNAQAAKLVDEITEQEWSALESVADS